MFFFPPPLCVCTCVCACDCLKIRSSVFPISNENFHTSLRFGFNSLPFSSFPCSLLSHSPTRTGAHTHTRTHAAVQEKEIHNRVSLVRLLRHLRREPTSHVWLYEANVSHQEQKTLPSLCSSMKSNKFELGVRQNITPAQLQLLYSSCHYLVCCSFCLDS